jgi:hypothetical protein
MLLTLWTTVRALTIIAEIARVLGWVSSVPICTTAYLSYPKLTLIGTCRDVFVADILTFSMKQQ